MLQALGEYGRAVKADWRTAFKKRRMASVEMIFPAGEGPHIGYRNIEKLSVEPLYR